MSKRIILVVFLVILTAVFILSNKYPMEWMQDSIDLVTKYFKPELRVQAIGRGKPWLPRNIRKILEAKYKIIYVDPKDPGYDLLFVTDRFTEEKLGSENENALRIFWTSEAYIPNLDHYDLVLGFNHIDSPKFIRLPYYYTAHRNNIEVNKLSHQKQGECNPKKPQFACFLVSNGSTDYIAENGNIARGVRIRDNMFHSLSEYKWVVSGGKHLNNIGRVIPREKKETMNWLGQCKFIIAYENQLYDGYITEKVFQAYLAGAIPIYWGDKRAVSDINKEAIIYANDYGAEKDLIDYIKKVDNDDELYCKIWNQPLITNHELDYDVVHDKLAKKLYELIDRQLQKNTK
jgi:alpha(1,3/1,4) fucosyltransferase